MKIRVLLIGFSILTSLFSCIQDEAPNAEADITTIFVPEDILKGAPRIENDKIVVMVKSATDLTNLAPEFELTPGATIEPASGTTIDFSSPQYYTVTSEDGKWKKRYEVSFDKEKIKTQYHFEHSELDSRNRFDTFYEVSGSEQKQYIWASGNPGFALTGTQDSKKPEGYPTVSYDFGVTGKCVKLETKSTGWFGESFGMRIAAGNLFIGSFDVLNATRAPLESTLFGLPFEFKPVSLTGWYKYKSGEKLTDENGNEMVGEKDSFDIYAIFYETDENVAFLDGTNVQTHPNIISIAKIENKEETNEWTFFDIPFKLKEGKVIDEDKLKNNKYNIAITFSSSVDGAHFTGAVGSTLYIDEVELTYYDND